MADSGDFIFRFEHAGSSPQQSNDIGNDGGADGSKARGRGSRQSSPGTPTSGSTSRGVSDADSLIDAFFDGELSRDDTVQFFDQLRHDPAATREVVGVQRALEALNEPVFSPDLTHAVLRRVDQERGWLSRSARRHITIGRVATAAAIVFAAGVVFTVQRTSPDLTRFTAVASPITNLTRFVSDDASRAVDRMAGAAEQMTQQLTEPLHTAFAAETDVDDANDALVADDFTDIPSIAVLDAAPIVGPPMLIADSYSVSNVSDGLSDTTTFRQPSWPWDMHAETGPGMGALPNAPSQLEFVSFESTNTQQSAEPAADQSAARDAWARLHGAAASTDVANTNTKSASAMLFTAGTGDPMFSPGRMGGGALPASLRGLGSGGGIALPANWSVGPTPFAPRPGHVLFIDDK